MTFDVNKATSADIAAEIAREQDQAAAAVAAADAAENAVQAERDAAILSGNQKAVDAIDAKLAERTGELRRSADMRTKRVELLQAKRDEALASEQLAYLDKIAADAERARLIGEELIRKDYAKAAGALATVLRKLRAIDGRMRRCNDALDKAGRATVETPNAIRHDRPRTEKVTTRRRVHLKDLNHPNHQEWQAVEAKRGIQIQTETESARETVHLPQSGEVPKWIEVDVTEEVHHAPTWAHPLYEEVKRLPAHDNPHNPIFAANEPDADERDSRLLTDMGL